MTDPLLELRAVRRQFGGVRAVDGVDLDVMPGDILGLIGPNGAGKTTLVNLITGHVKLDQGSIGLHTEDGRREIGHLPVHRTAALGVARTFQNLRLYSDLSVIDNVVIGMHAHRRSDTWATLVPVGPGRQARSTRRDLAGHLLDRVGLDAGAHGARLAGTLSYGDQRRLEIARALALSPRLLLLDEPAAGMNATEKDRLADLMRSLVAGGDLTVVLIEHDLRLVMGLCNRVAVMDFGRKIADGPPAGVAADPAVIAAYLGARAAESIGAQTSGAASPGPAATVSAVAAAAASQAATAETGGPAGPAGPVLLEIDDLEVRYGAVEAVQGVSLRVAEGEVVALIGANGAGKSTILRTVSGLVRAANGTARFGDTDLLRAGAPAIVGAGLIHVPEGREILGTLTVEENLLLGAWHRRDRVAIGQDVAAQYERFPVLGERRHLPAGQLSGGEQQMLAIGRALLGRPRLLLLDEPSLGLAPRLVDTIFDLVAALHRDGLTILLVEQNAVRALELASRAYVLETGRITMSGDAADLLADPKVQAAYLGT